MSQSNDLPQKPLSAGDKGAEPRKDHEAGTTASHRLYSEASQAWRSKASEARKAPLSVPDGQHYHVKDGDTLSDIAARRLRADHEGVNAHSIAKEESRLRKLNSGDHASLSSKGKKQRDSLQAGWDLKIYDSVHDKKAAPSAPAAADAAAGQPGRKQDVAPAATGQPDAITGAPEAKANPVGINKDIGLKIASQLSPADLAAMDVSGPQSPKAAAPGDAVPQVAPKPKAKDHTGGTTPGTAPDLSPVPLPPERPKEFPRTPASHDVPAVKTSPTAPEIKQKPEKPEKPEAPTGASPEDMLDRSRFYQHQMNGWSCSATAMAMMYSNTETGRPPTPGDLEHFERVTGTTQHGYRGSLSDMAAQARSQGLEAKAYQYGRFGDQGMNDLDKELAMGHSAVARIINPHTGHPHYIYVAGRTSDGKYVIGDPDRHNNPSSTYGHGEPITRRHLEQMMSGRDGFVAGWS
jgi:hypothetical protein